MRLTESKLRKIIREELESVAVNEDMFPDMGDPVAVLAGILAAPIEITAQAIDALMQCGFAPFDILRIIVQDRERLLRRYTEASGGTAGMIAIVFELAELQGVSITANCLPASWTSWIYENSPELLPRRD
tara:strand:- start:86 stop:475 length:390 start_codon:yes stop_codon:yes gene_type:complete